MFRFAIRYILPWNASSVDSKKARPKFKMLITHMFTS